MKHKGYLLDIDHTLYDYETTHAVALDSAIASVLGRTPLDRPSVEARYLAARKTVNHRLAETAASHNRLLYFQLLCEDIGLNSMAHTLELYDVYWDTFLAHMRLDDGVREFLEALPPDKVCLVTDLTAHIQHRKIRRLGLADLVGYVVTSEEAGREKPHPTMFELALAKIGVAPDEACMVGDSYAKDALGAAALGISAYWLNRTGKPRDLDAGVREIHSFHDLREHVYAR